MYGDFTRPGRRFFLTVTETRCWMAIARPGFPKTTACSPKRKTFPGADQVATYITAMAA